MSTFFMVGNSCAISSMYSLSFSSKRSSSASTCFLEATRPVSPDRNMSTFSLMGMLTQSRRNICDASTSMNSTFAPTLCPSSTATSISCPTLPLNSLAMRRWVRASSWYGKGAEPRFCGSLRAW